MTERFGPYELAELLGRGGMGEVWRAFDTRKSRTVALKRLSADMTGEREFEDRFRREAHAAARLNDPHVIPIHDFGEIGGRLFLDMRLVEGRDLGAVLEQDGPLAPLRTVSVLEQVASALDAAHEEGLVHRDVKPSNILLTPSKRTVGPEDFVYLIDFGIATGAALGTRLTQTGMAIGTAAYMAPERFTDGEDTDPRIDVYALGCVLHEALTGHPPFTGRDFVSLMYQHINNAPPMPSRLVETLPAGLDDVVARALTKDREGRYARAGDLAVAARRALRDAQSVPRHARPTEPPRPSPPPSPPPSPQIAPSERPGTRVGPPPAPGPRPSTPAASSDSPPSAQPWRPAPPRYTQAAPAPLAGPPAPRVAGAPVAMAPPPRTGRIVAAALAIPFLLVVTLFCVVGTVQEFGSCSTRATSCAAGATGVIAVAVAVLGVGLAVTGLTAVGRRTTRRAGLAWAALGGSIVLFLVTAVLAVV